MPGDLILPFDTDDPQFVRGVEVGAIWQLLESGVRPVEATVHVSNAEMMLRIADAAGATVQSEDWNDDTWLRVTFT